MNARSKDEIREIIIDLLLTNVDDRVKFSKQLAKNLEDNESYLCELFAQLSQPSSSLENEMLENISPTNSIQSSDKVERKANRERQVSRKTYTVSRCTQPTVPMREAEQTEKIKETKVDHNLELPVIKCSRESSKSFQNKEVNEVNDAIVILNADDVEKSMYEDAIGNSTPIMNSTLKHSSFEKSLSATIEVERKAKRERQVRRKTYTVSRRTQPTVPMREAEQTEKIKKTKVDDNFELTVIKCSRESSKSFQSKEVNEVNDVILNADDIKKSMYEDAIENFTIMNSTLKHSSFEKSLSATILLKRLPNQASKLNETVIQKAVSTRNSNRLKETESTEKMVQDNMQPYQKTPAQYNDCNELITHDEPSPEVRKPTLQKKQLNRKQINKKQTKGMLAISSEDEIPNTLVKMNIKNVPVVIQENKTTHKSNALFSPYAKEPVKKRVEAFKQAVIHSPRSVDVDAPIRITRSKTRAMATTEMQAETKSAEKNVAQILARKSLAKAKKILLAKQKNNDEFKENKKQLPERINKLLTQTDKPNVKMQQLKTQLPKTSATNLMENLEKKEQEDLTKKRDEALKLLIKERKRKQQKKVLKLAREAEARTKPLPMR